MRKLGDESMSRTSTLSAIDGWLSEKLAKQSSTAFDIADCMRVFARHGNTLSTAISYAESLFKQKGTLQLLTGHKAKGLEWETVFHLDPHLCRDDEQDRNLRYVITTRSKDTLYEIDGREIKWPNDHPH
jgi:superfamily I DNA/RNA helicase